MGPAGVCIRRASARLFGPGGSSRLEPGLVALGRAGTPSCHKLASEDSAGRASSRLGDKERRRRRPAVPCEGRRGTAQHRALSDRDQSVNEGYIYKEVIDRRGAGQPVDTYLSGRYTHSTLDQWRRHIAEGRVLLDGSPCATDATLQPLQRLEYHRAPWEEPSAPLDLPVLYDHAGVLVVAKPAGLPTMPGGGFLQHTLLHQVHLLAPSASPMHRLGRWTSGAVVCARTPQAGAALTAQFVARSVHKRYRALASGSPDEESFAVAAPIGPVAYPPLGTLHAATPGGRPASSQFTVLERRNGCFLADVTIATGRPHQIRIHAAAEGHPLVGDPLYEAGGKPSPDGTALPGDPGYRLHAAEVGFVHPTSGEAVRVQARPPSLLQTAAERRR
ncbi:MAG: RNA pseudouridine synthase [Deltaproteobacteria bacterium]|nr:RNA pseudouridine synthase [Deltaproteobacteria bacterium]